MLNRHCTAIIVSRWKSLFVFCYVLWAHHVLVKPELHKYRPTGTIRVNAYEVTCFMMWADERLESH